MTDREIFEKETGFKEPKLYFVNDDNGLFARTQIAEYWKTYSAWLEKRNEWVSVEDRLPECNGRYVRVLVETDEGVIIANYWKESNNFQDEMTGYIIDTKLWRPLPTPPDEAKRGRGC